MRVLLVDDDPRLLGLLREALEESGHDVRVADRAEAAEPLLAPGPEAPELLLLDVGLPGLDGLGFLERIRSRGLDVPVLFLTARQGIEDRVRGLRSGADDYIVKPFALQELLARMEAVERRHRAPRERAHGRLVLREREKVVASGELRVELSPREFQLLDALLSAGCALERRTLLTRVWGVDFDPGTNVVEVTVSRLRRKVRHLGVEITKVAEGYRVLVPEEPRG